VQRRINIVIALFQGVNIEQHVEKKLHIKLKIKGWSVISPAAGEAVFEIVVISPDPEK
jgi:hypothetical protein